MGRTRWFVVTALVASAVARPGVGADLVVYDDALAAGWQDWSWDTTVDLAVGSPAAGGTGTSIGVTYTGAWGGLYLRHPGAAIDLAPFERVRFEIHGGSAGGQQLRLYPVDGSGAAGGSIPLAPPAVGVFTTVEIDVAALGLAALGGLVWQDTSGGPQPALHVDEIVLVDDDSSPPGVGPDIVIDPRADRHRIPDEIYGVNFLDDEPGFAAEIALPVRRRGGNATTRYSWQLDVSNRASDWYFENIANPDPGTLPDGSAADVFVAAGLATGTDTIMTVPLIGWTPKSRDHTWGFSVAKYGPQQDTDPFEPDAGNGVTPGGAPVTGNDPADTSVAVTTAFVTGWIAHLVGAFGPADAGGVAYYDLDNEPMLWHETHRDVHPDPVGYDELRDRTWAYAAAVKAADPSARTLGPATWGWTAWFYSALDAAGGGAWWIDPPDRNAHGGVELTAWYLQQMAAWEQANGTRILDYLDLHYYPQSGVALQPAGDLATRDRRLRATRSLWDPTYVDESWIGEPVRLVPRMRDWVQAHYPGTRLAVTEYNFGGLEHVNGALAQADVLGLFGREGLDLATLWAPPDPAEPGAFAFRVYRNYDGAGARFGRVGVRATSADQAVVSAYASLRDGRDVVVALVNKTRDALDTPVTLAAWSPITARRFEYAPADLGQIRPLPDVVFAGGAATLALPAESITVLELPGLGRPGDTDGDGATDVADLLAVLAAWGACPMSPAACPADVTADGAVDVADLLLVLAEWG
jgi:hypothetical protein